jgi:type II secretory pathway pseudopilin PulG
MNTSASPAAKRTAGATLVETMVAAVILMVMAVAGGAFLYSGRAGIAFQRNRRAALEAAASRLEAVRASAYEDLRLPPGWTNAFLSGGPGNWTMTSTDPGVTVTLNGFSAPAALQVAPLDVDGASPAQDCILVTAAVGYRDGDPNRVTLRTIYAPIR